MFELSDLTAQIVRYLKEHEKGATIKYSELTKAVGSRIDSHSHNLIYGIKILKRDHNQVWLAVRPGIGVRRLGDLEIAERLPGWFLNGARRKLNRGGVETEIVDISQLDIAEQSRFSVNCLRRELAMQSLSRASARQLEKVARGSSNDLPSFNIVEWATNLMPIKIRTGKKAP